MPSDDFWADLPAKPRKSLPSLPPTPIQKPSVGPPTAISVAAEPTSPPPPARWRSVGPLVLRINLIVCAAVVGSGLWVVQGVTVRASDFLGSVDHQAVPVEIVRGARTADIALQLENEGIILSRWPFLFYVALKQKTIRAGTYLLSPTQTTAEIVNAIAAGAVTEHRVTIPEGWRIEQMAEYFDQAKIVTKDEFLAAARYDPVRYPLPPGIKREPGESLEGLLFPDTYQFPYGITSPEIVTDMLTNFTRRTADLKPTNEQVILAAIVEREAKLAADRPIIAGVYQNRLKNNLKLEADPTVQYARDSQQDLDNRTLPRPWWSSITSDDYQRVKSSFNTYLISGLPPAPIANPGLASLEAAVHPTQHDYYFFISRSDGTTIYSKTKEEHDRAKQ